MFTLYHVDGTHLVDVEQRKGSLMTGLPGSWFLSHIGLAQKYSATTKIVFHRKQLELNLIHFCKQKRSVSALCLRWTNCKTYIAQGLEKEKGDYGVDYVCSLEMRAHHGHTRVQGWEKERFRSSVWFFRCSWKGFFADTWQPWLMVLALQETDRSL